MNVRPRQPLDLPACVDALAEVHRVNGYPKRWPADPASWLDPPNLLAAWVAERSGTILGHVVVTTSPQDSSLVHATGRPVRELASVSRLFVRPDARGVGLARDLLARAASFAVHADFGLVLEVVDDATEAIVLYERLGWRLVEVRPADWTTDDGHSPLMRLYVLP